MKIFFGWLTICLGLSGCDSEPKETVVQNLYHGSVHKNIDLLEPKSGSISGQVEKKLVVATPSISFASCFLFEWDDTWVHLFVTRRTPFEKGGILI